MGNHKIMGYTIALTGCIQITIFANTPKCADFYYSYLSSETGKYVLDKSIKLLDTVVVVIQTLQRASFDEV